MYAKKKSSKRLPIFFIGIIISVIFYCFKLYREGVEQ